MPNQEDGFNYFATDIYTSVTNFLAFADSSKQFCVIPNHSNMPSQLYTITV